MVVDVRWTFDAPVSIKNLDKNVLRNLTLAYRKGYLRWNKAYLLIEMMRQVRTGKGDFPSVNRMKWMLYKIRKFGISHSLGILSGRLHAGVSQAKVFLRSNRAKGTITATTRFTTPKYFRYVAGGTSRSRAYDFPGSALKRTLRYLPKEIEIGLSKESDIIGV
jgi:hypothetical protein